MSNKIRARNRQPFDFQDGIKVRGREIAYCIDKINDLKQIDISKIKDNEVVLVLGNVSVNDGSGGFYIWNVSSNLSENGLTVIIPNSGPANGRWHKIILA